MIAGDRPRVEVEWFERLYRKDDDPWQFATSRYEDRKYERTLDALAGRHFARSLEVGCSIGVFTGRLAPQCDRLVAIDVSDVALARARERLAGQPHVSLRRASFPEQMPAGRWDLVVCSEVLYYLDRPALNVALGRLGEVLDQGGTVLAVHWRAATATYPFRGDEVHQLLLDRFGDRHALDARTPQYRLDRFDGEGTARTDSSGARRPSP